MTDQPSEKAYKAAAYVLAELSRRRGFRQALDDVGQEVYNEILRTFAQHIHNTYEER